MQVIDALIDGGTHSLASFLTHIPNTCWVVTGICITKMLLNITKTFIENIRYFVSSCCFNMYSILGFWQKVKGDGKEGVDIVG